MVRCSAVRQNTFLKWQNKLILKWIYILKREKEKKQNSTAHISKCALNRIQNEIEKKIGFGIETKDKRKGKKEKYDTLAHTQTEREEYAYKQTASIETNQKKT